MRLYPEMRSPLLAFEGFFGNIKHKSMTGGQDETQEFQPEALSASCIIGRTELWLPRVLSSLKPQTEGEGAARVC